MKTSFSDPALTVAKSLPCRITLDGFGSDRDRGGKSGGWDWTNGVTKGYSGRSECH